MPHRHELTVTRGWNRVNCPCHVEKGSLVPVLEAAQGSGPVDWNLSSDSLSVCCLPGFCLLIFSGPEIYKIEVLMTFG